MSTNDQDYKVGVNSSAGPWCSGQTAGEPINVGATVQTICGAISRTGGTLCSLPPHEHGKHSWESAVPVAELIQRLRKYHKATLSSPFEGDCVSEAADALGAMEPLAKIGRSWNENSSLEKWFPFTAEELERRARIINDLDARVTELEAENAAPQEEASLQAMGRQSACVPPVAPAPVAELIVRLRAVTKPSELPIGLCAAAADSLAAMDTRYAALWLWCDGHSKIIDMHKQRITELEAQIATERAECLEQCRLLAMGGEREARLMAENAALREWIRINIGPATEKEMIADIDAVRKP